MLTPTAAATAMPPLLVSAEVPVALAPVPLVPVSVDLLLARPFLGVDLVVYAFLGVRSQCLAAGPGGLRSIAVPLLASAAVAASFMVLPVPVMT